MNIIFMGTPSFALPTLDKLHGSPDHDVVAVFSRPDARSRRGNELFPSRVKERALEHGLPVHTPPTLRDPDVVRLISGYHPDVVVVAAYGGILPREVLDIPRHGCLNVHGSLLPRWRGAAPVQRAILDGDDIAGVCIMQMEEGLDTGLYHTVGSVEIASKTTEELGAQLADMGADGMLEALAGIEDGTYVWYEQDESQVTYAEKVGKDETLLRPGLTSREFLRRVQASSHRAPSRCVVCGKRIAVLKAHPCEFVLPQGEVVLEHRHVYLGLKGRAVELDRVKPESKRDMEARQWIAGLRSDDATWNVLPEYYHKLPVYG